jgi:hypothetical protein
MFLCPCCGESYLVPLAFCESVLEERIRGGWTGTVGPAKCVACQKTIVKGDSVIIRRGSGTSQDGEREDLPAGSKVTVVDVSTWEGEGSIFLVRLPTGKAVYVVRAQLAHLGRGPA